MRKLLSYLFIIVGIGIIAYPTASEKYYMYQQEKLIAEWQDALFIVDQGVSEEEEEEFDSWEFDDSFITDAMDGKVGDIKEKEAKAKAEKEKKEKEKKAREEYVKNHLEGMLKIDKIKLNLPILKGGSEKNLQLGLASLDHSGQLGGLGNYAIAGHRNRTYGRNFNRLDEVEEGDLIEANDGENIYQYIVSEKLYVLPEETWVLNSKKGEKEITLITCHPMGNPTLRLIIKGTIIE